MRPKSAFASLLCALVLGCGEAAKESAPAAPAQGVFGQAPPAVEGTPSVITLSTAGSTEPRVFVEDPVIDQLGLQFMPNLLLVRAGQSVSFTNSESIGHNVHLRYAETDSTVLNTDTDPSQAVDFAFDAEGAYAVGCDVHPGMRALVFVTSAEYGTFAEDDGAFLVQDVAPGTYTLRVWSADPERRTERTIEVTGPSTEVDLGSAG